KIVYPPPIKPDQFTDPAPAEPKAEDGKITWKLEIGSLPSAIHVTGVHARLQNLGFRVPPGDGKTVPATVVSAYQKRYRKPDTGACASIENDLRDRHDKA